MLFAFDLDGTLLKGNSSVAFCRYLYKANKISLVSVLCACIYYFQHLYLGLSLEELHRKSLYRILSKFSLEELQKDSEKFVQENLEILCNKPVIKALYDAKTKGHEIAVFSASPLFLVENIAKRLGVKNYRGSKYLIDKDRGVCMIEYIVDGKKKGFFLTEELKRLSLQKQDVVAYSDSYLDVPFLSVAGTAFVVSPDKKLKKVARRRGWKELAYEREEQTESFKSFSANDFR